MATNYIGELLSSRRRERGWSYGDLARAAVGAMTPKQTSRIARRLVLFEREGVRDLGLLRKVVVALDLDVAQVDELLRRQHEEELEAWQAWASEPVPMELHMRALPGFWCRLPLPVEIADDELRAVEYAKSLTAGCRELRVVLTVDRRVSLTFAGGQLVARTEATPGRSVTPVMEISGKRIVFEARDRKERKP